MGEGCPQEGSEGRGKFMLKWILLSAVAGVGAAYLTTVDFSNLGFGWMTADQVAPKSVADSGCSGKWRNAARNDLWIACYMQVEQARFCQMGERQHLAWALREYQRSKRAYEGKLLAYQLNGQMRLIASSGSNNDPVSRINSAYGEAAKQAAKDKDFVAALRMRTMSDRKLRELMRALARKGLVVQDEFYRESPGWAFEAFEGVEPISPSCPAA